MKKIFVLMMVCASVAMAAVPQAGGVPEGITMVRTQAGEPEADGWCTAVSTGGNFSVRLPIPFNDFNAPAAKGKLVYVVGGKSNDGVKISATRVPVMEERKDCASYLTQMAQKAHARERSFVRWGGYECLDYTGAGKGTNGIARVICLPDGALLLMVEYPAGADEKEVRGLTKRFFESVVISR